MASRSPSSSPGSATGSGTDPARPDTGEPLGGGSDSDSDFGLSKFDCSAGDAAVRLDGEDLEIEFESAADRVRELVQTASREQLLYLYARFKQVKVGKCNTPKPGFFDFEGQRKWSAWKQLGDMSADQAMLEYVTCVNALDPQGSQKSSEQKSGERRTGFGGPAVSCLYQEENISCPVVSLEYLSLFSPEVPSSTRLLCPVPVMRTEFQEHAAFLEEDKNIFDYCRENNIEHISEAIGSRNVDVNARDEEGRALLHWACDRGHKDLVSLLLQNNADINSQVLLLPPQVQYNKWLNPPRHNKYQRQSVIIVIGLHLELGAAVQGSR
ncbi:hypothetical protein DNTS_033707 [Danionella cerebrum]|uniref:Acyl-CoA-binding domain-containing protein 6 n=1 Tax=Danionella cerebrum TaxID=2873325 RepID=A0A553Q0X8_9TELE|nr:hypothetical protein DNTS_033707 [Danionella translucida]